MKSEKKVSQWGLGWGKARVEKLSGRAVILPVCQALQSPLNQLVNVNTLKCLRIL